MWSFARHDPAGRLTADIVTSLGATGQNVDGTVRRIGTTYDDLGRVQTVTSYADSSGTTAVSQVKYEYNGLGQVVREYQEHNGLVDTSTLYVQYNYATAAHNARLTSVVYPNGRRVHYTYGTAGSASDLLNRLEAIQDDDGSGNPGTVLASYKYLGADTVVEEDYAEPDVQLDYASNNYSGFDRLGRVTDQLWETYSGTAVDEYRYTYDRAGNRTTRERDDAKGSEVVSGRPG